MSTDDENEQERKRGTGDLTALGRTLMPFAKRLLGAKGLIGADVILHWQEIAGDELAAFSRPLKIDFRRGEKNNGVLFVEVPSGGFALELQHKEKLIIDRVNVYFGYAAVSRVKIVQNNGFKLNEAPGHKCERLQKTLVTPEEEIYIKQLSEDVQNTDLQNILFRLGCRVWGQVKSEKEKDEV